MRFSLGDVVELKSGGPSMTFDEISADSVHCVWFIDNKREGSWFNAATLTKTS